MVATEDPAITLARLLSCFLEVSKPDGNPATLKVGLEWYDSALFKSCDGQVTVGLDRSEEQRLELQGNLRRQVTFLRVNAWATNNAERTVDGRSMRDSIREDVRRVVREKRKSPATVLYDYGKVVWPSSTHKAFACYAPADPPPTSTLWQELTSAEYVKIGRSDNVRHQVTTYGDGVMAYMLFKFKVDAAEGVLKSLALTFEGYGLSPSGSGCTVSVWNHATGTWAETVWGTGTTDETLTINLSSGLGDFVLDGYLYLLARTAYFSDDEQPAALWCDYASLQFTVNGVTYADVLGYRNVDDVRPKPPIFRSEVTVKASMFETVPVT
jgi:hypothetical protein